MLNRYWPLFDIRIETPRLTMQIGDDNLLEQLANVAAAGIHGADEVMFGDRWTNQEPDAAARHLLQWNWRARANWSSSRWTASFVAIHEGEVVGSAWMFAEDFALLGSFGTSSWLGLQHQGKGLGKEMRAGLLAMGFGQLNAKEARTNMLSHNAASLGVTKSFGYEFNGRFERKVGSEAITGYNYRMSSEHWQSEVRDRYEISITGLDNCHEMFGER